MFHPGWAESRGRKGIFEMMATANARLWRVPTAVPFLLLLGCSAEFFDDGGGKPASGSGQPSTSGSGGSDDNVAMVKAALNSPLAVSYHEKIGAFGDGGWALDRNGNGVWEGCDVDRCLNFGVAEDIPIAGRWRNVDEYDSIGVYRPSEVAFYIDYNGDGIWNGCDVDKCTGRFISAKRGNKPIVGYWSAGADRQGIGIHRRGAWYMDVDLDFHWDGNRGGDRYLRGFGDSSTLPVVGNLTGDQGSIGNHIGYFKDGDWVWDRSGNYKFDDCTIDRCFSFGMSGDSPLIGHWLDGWVNGDGIGVFRASENAWYMDRNRDLDWDGCTTDDCLEPFAGPDQKAVVGVWPPVRYSSDGDNSLGTSNPQFFENSAAIVPPGANSNCPDGRAFFAVGQYPADMLQADLDCSTGACGFTNVTSIWGSLTSQINAGGALDFPGTDNVTELGNDGSIIHIRQGHRVNAGRIYGAIYVWRSTTCGNTWQLRSVIEAVDTNLFSGQCGLPQRPDRPAVFRPSNHTFYLDWNSSGAWDQGIDREYPNFVTSFNPITDYPVMGQWDPVRCSAPPPAGLGLPVTNCLQRKIGMFSDGIWTLDLNGNGVAECGTDDLCTPAGAPPFGQAGDIPIIGKWNAANGDYRDLVGVWRQGWIYLDMNGNLEWDGCGVDSCANSRFGQIGDRPITGLFTGQGFLGDRTTTIGVYRYYDGDWFLDANDNMEWDDCGIDTCVWDFGAFRAHPVAGIWDGSPVLHESIGTFEDGYWALDRNGNGQWDGCTTDLCYSNFGDAGDIPLVGRFDDGDPNTTMDTWYGGWDRVEAKVDRNNGNIYIGVGCDFRQKSESVLLVSGNTGATWTGHSLEGFGIRPARPMMLTAAGGDRLYVYGIEGGSPTLWIFDVSGTTLTSAGKTAIASGAGYLPWAAQGRSLGDGSEGIAFVARSHSTDYLYITYPRVFHRPGATDKQVVDVMKLTVTPSGSGYTVSSGAIDTLSDNLGTGSVTQATLIEGPNHVATGVRGALLYWKETGSSANRGNPLTMRGYVIAEDTNFETLTAGPFILSTDADGNKRSWNNYYITGDYVKGVPFVENDTPSYLVQWTETPVSGGTDLPRTLHAAIVRVRP